MDQTDNPNRILPVPGVDRNLTISTEASLRRQNDDSTVNRMRRVMSEDGQRVEALLRCRNRTQKGKHRSVIGTLNVDTLKGNRAEELDHLRKKVNMEILGIQEHRIIHKGDKPDPIEFKRIGSSCLITSSGWRNESQASQGGVGLMLGSKARKALLKVRSINERILIAEFDGNPKTTIIVAYSPTNVADESKVEEFYEALRNTINDVPAHNFLVVMGDFNARLGPEFVPYSYHDKSNRNGGFLGEMMVECDLAAANAQFQKKSGKLWTHKNKGTGFLSQIDYILVRKKWRNSVHNAEAYSSFSTVKSDHRVVSAKLWLSLRTSKHAQKTRYDWKRFSASPELQENYTVAVTNRFEVLHDDSNEVRYDKFVAANKIAMEEVVPKKPKNLES